MAKKKRGAWKRHDGAEGERCEAGRRAQRIQVRPIGSNRAFVKRGGEIDWSQKFDWRVA